MANMVPIKVDPQTRRLLKILAAQEGVSLAAYVGLVAINKALPQLISKSRKAKAGA